MKRPVFIGIIIAAVICVGAFAYWMRLGGPSTTATPSANPNAKVAATIIYSDNGFEPASVTVKSGDTLQVTNSSSRNVQFDSDPHPAHTDNSELNVGVVTMGKSTTFVVTKSGTFGFHNHLKSSDKGSITVE